MPIFEGEAKQYGGLRVSRPVVIGAKRKIPRRPPAEVLERARGRQWEDPTPPTIGVPNPYGAGVSAYEPETELYDGGVDDPMLKGWDVAFNKVQESRRTVIGEDGLSGGAAIGKTELKGIPGLSTSGGGSVANVIAAGKSLLGKPYVWGGTTARGVDCSGLIFYAFNQAGINVPRMRASDYGKMGQQVDQAGARAGDLVYWDQPGATDHVGIYLGDGYVLQAPQTGDVVKVSKVWGNATYRRVLNDASFGQQATPGGGSVTSYGGKAATKQFLVGQVSIASPVQIKQKG